MGLGNIDIGIVILVLASLVLILLIITITQIVRSSKLVKKYAKFMTGKDGKSLEQTILGVMEENKMLKISTDKNKKDIRTLYKNMEYTYQKMGLEKYDAFNTMGGKLSFSLALLNENNDGFIMNSVHSSDGCYSYTKEIKKGQCDIALGDEEKKALARAMDSRETN
jgi:hypothetical protein